MCDDRMIKNRGREKNITSVSNIIRNLEDPH